MYLIPLKTFKVKVLHRFKQHCANSDDMSTISSGETTHKINNNRPGEHAPFPETLPILSHISPGGTFVKGVYSRGTRRRGGKTRWRNETTTSPISTHRRCRAHPPEFTRFLPPTPNPIHPSPPRQGPVFEDACRGGGGGLRGVQRNDCVGHRVGRQCQMLSTHSYPDRSFLIGTRQWKSHSSLTCVQAGDKKSPTWKSLFVRRSSDMRRF